MALTFPSPPMPWPCHHIMGMREGVLPGPCGKLLLLSTGEQLLLLGSKSTRKGFLPAPSRGSEGQGPQGHPEHRRCYPFYSQLPSSPRPLHLYPQPGSSFSVSPSALCWGISFPSSCPLVSVPLHPCTVNLFKPGRSQGPETLQTWTLESRAGALRWE